MIAKVKHLIKKTQPLYACNFFSNLKYFNIFLVIRNNIDFATNSSLFQV